MEDSILNEIKLKIVNSTTLEELHVLTVKLHQRIQFILVREKDNLPPASKQLFKNHFC